jgi:hypothetical protein
MNTAPINTTSTYPDTHKAPATIHFANAADPKLLIQTLDARLRGRLESRNLTEYMTTSGEFDLQVVSTTQHGFQMRLAVLPFLTPVKGGHVITSIDARYGFTKDPTGGMLQQLWDTIVEAGGEFTSVETTADYTAMLLQGRFAYARQGHPDNRRFSIGVEFKHVPAHARW